MGFTDEIQVLKLRTPPAKFLSDIESGKDVFFAIKLVSDVKTRYWVTSKASFTLWNTTAADGGHVALTKDAGQIAGKIDGQDEDGISEIQWGVDLSRFGGGVGQISNFSFTILNQEQMNVQLDAENFIHQTVSIYMGFVDTSTGTGLGDMVQIGTFMVDNIEPYHYARLVFSCVDVSMHVANALLPKKLITKASHPRALEESIGKPLPLLYGDFQTYQSELVVGGYGMLHKHFEEYDLAPTVVTSFAKSAFDSDAPTHTIASHTLFSFGAGFMFGNDVLGEIDSTDIAFINSVYGGVDILKQFVATWYLVPDAEQADITTAIESSTNQFDYAKDKDALTAYVMGGTGNLFYGLSKQGEGTLRGITFEDVPSLQVMALYGLISGASGTYNRMQMRFIDDDTAAGAPLDTFPNGFTVSTLHSTIFPPGPDWFDDFNWSYMSENVAYGFLGGGANAQIHHVVVVFKSVIALRYGKNAARKSIRAGRGGRG